MLTYCEKCDDVVDYDVEFTPKQKIFKGREIQYLAKEAYCKECHLLIFVPEIHDYNLKQISNSEAIRERN